MPKLLSVGLTGTVITALCCFTPILVVIATAVGLSWITGYLDRVLLPLLVMFIVVTIVALFRKRADGGPPA